MGNCVHSRCSQSGKPAFSTGDESPQRKRANILSLQLRQKKTPKQKQNHLVSTVIAQSWDTGDDMVTNLGTSGGFSPLTSLYNVPTIPNDGAPRNYRVSSHSSPLIILKNIFPYFKENIPVLIGTGATLNSTNTNQSLLRILKQFSQ